MNLDPTIKKFQEKINQNMGLFCKTKYECDLCKDTSAVLVNVNGEERYKFCDCAIKKWNLERIEQSGIKYQLENCTFENYLVEQPWQNAMKKTALNFAQNQKGFLYLGGQVGCGKTHLCIAIVGFLIKTMGFKYMPWRESTPKIKAVVNDETDYNNLMSSYKNVKVLYIDDLFKGKTTDADKKLAFEIIDFRYINRDMLITIISSEFTIDDLMEIDEGIGSRIYEASKNNCCVIGKDFNKNYRLKDKV